MQENTDLRRHVDRRIKNEKEKKILFHPFFRSNPNQIETNQIYIILSIPVALVSEFTASPGWMVIILIMDLFLFIYSFITIFHSHPKQIKYVSPACCHCRCCLVLMNNQTRTKKYVITSAKALHCYQHQTKCI